MQTISVRPHYRCRLIFLLFPGWVRGFVVGRHIFFRQPRERVDPVIMRHELAHVCQYAEHGIAGFLWRYLWLERHHPYREKSFEQEARRVAADPRELSRRWPQLRLKLPADAAEGQLSDGI